MTNDSKHMDDMKFNELRIYEDIYDIFESELAEIGRYVSFTDKNLTTYSNKIHELHLRVCSEIENLLKIVIHKSFVSQEEVKGNWETRKSEYLGENIDTYIELRRGLNSRDKRKIESDLFGKPDFGFYFEIARSKFNLHKKAVRFTGGIDESTTPLNEFIPFAFESYVPSWWEAYNDLKHNKMARYHKCNLGHLIHAIAGLYLLMLYRKHYQNGNARKEDLSFISRHPNVGYPRLDVFGKESRFFYTVEHVDISRIVLFMGQPDFLTESQYAEIKFIPNLALGVGSDGIFNKDSSMFFVELDYKQIANKDPENPTAGLELMRQKTRYISFVN